MLVLIDLDYTILDSARLKESLAKIFNLSFSDYEKFYFSNFRNKKINYSPQKHLSILIRQGKITRSREIEKKLNQLLGRINDYVFKEAALALSNYRAKGYKIILLSQGDMAWQKSKIKGLKLKKFFDKIVITEVDKISGLGFLKNNNEEVIIIDDNARHGIEIKKALRRGKLILLSGPYAKNIKHNFKIYNRKYLTEI